MMSRKPTRKPIRKPARKANIKPRIVLVEDDESREIVAKMFEKLGYRVDTLANGREALSYFEELTPKKIRNLKAIFSDVMMPELDGLNLLERVREHPGLKDVPVVMVSSSADEIFFEDARRFGAAEFLIKPLSISKIEATLEELSEKRRAS
jgi:CheY-like chemotaxis protein